MIAEGDIESDNWNGFKENLCRTSTRPNQGNRGMAARVNNMAACDWPWTQKARIGSIFISAIKAAMMFQCKIWKKMMD